MNRIGLGVLCGLGFAIVDVLLMLPLKYKTKRERTEAMTAAFIERFMIGFIIPNLQLGIHPIVTGIIVGAGLSIPSSLITRAYIPINAIGIVGGGIIGLIASMA